MSVYAVLFFSWIHQVERKSWKILTVDEGCWHNQKCSISPHSSHFVPLLLIVFPCIFAFWENIKFYILKLSFVFLLKKCKNVLKFIDCFFLHRFFDIPISVLPNIRSSSEVYGKMVCNKSMHLLTKLLRIIELNTVQYLRNVSIVAVWQCFTCFVITLWSMNYVDSCTSIVFNNIIIQCLGGWST